MAKREENEVLYDTIRTFLDKCLLSDKSLLWPDQDYWTLENLKSLKHHMIDAPEYGNILSFEEKLEKQMKEVSLAEWAIVCDIYFVYFLPSTNITLDKVRKDIGWAASQAGITPPTESDPIWQVQTHGFTRTAIKYHIKYSQFWFIILFALHVKEHESPKTVISNHHAMRSAMDMVLENLEVRRDRAYDMLLIPRLNKPLISNYFEPHKNFSNYFNRNRLGRFRFVFRSSSDQPEIGSMLR